MVGGRLGLEEMREQRNNVTKIFWRKDTKQRGPDTVYRCAPSVMMFSLL